MANFTFEVDNIKIPLMACLDFSQSYKFITAESTTRTMNGSGFRQGTYKKLKTTISGSGSIPVGLSQLVTTGDHILKCAAPRSVDSTSNIIIIPSERRTEEEYAPIGLALINGIVKQVSCTIDGNTATLGTIEGAESYQVLYIPQLTVIISPVEETTDMRTKRTSWTLEAEEK